MTASNTISTSAERSRHAVDTATQAASADEQFRADDADQRPDERGAAILAENEVLEHTKKEGSGVKPARMQSARTAAHRRAKVSKTEAALKFLRRKNGAALSYLREATGWQAHSVRGFLSGTVKRKLGLNLSSEVSKLGVRRYRISTVAVD